MASRRDDIARLRCSSASADAPIELFDDIVVASLGCEFRGVTLQYGAQFQQIPKIRCVDLRHVGTSSRNHGHEPCRLERTDCFTYGVPRDAERLGEPVLVEAGARFEVAAQDLPCDLVGNNLAKRAMLSPDTHVAVKQMADMAPLCPLYTDERVDKSSFGENGAVGHHPIEGGIDRLHRARQPMLGKSLSEVAEVVTGWAVGLGRDCRK